MRAEKVRNVRAKERHSRQLRSRYLSRLIGFMMTRAEYERSKEERQVRQCLFLFLWKVMSWCVHVLFGKLLAQKMKVRVHGRKQKLQKGIIHAGTGQDMTGSGNFCTISSRQENYEYKSSHI